MKPQLKSYTCMIIDDDQYAIDYLNCLIDSHPRLKLLQHSQHPSSILADWSHKGVSKFDFLFIDVEMPDINGLDFARQTRSFYEHLVITSSHTKYAIDAFEVHSTHYLLKPFTQQKFINTIQSIIERVPTIKPVEPLSLFLKSGKENTSVKVNYKDIIMISALEHYCLIHTIDKRYIQHTSLQHLNNSFALIGSFLRVNRSTIISFEHVISITGNQILMSNGEKINVGPTYKNEIMTRFKVV